MNGWTAFRTSSSVSVSSNAADDRGLALLEANRGRVARLDLDDAAGGREQLLGLDHRRRAVVGADAGVLERTAPARGTLGARERVAEVDLRRLDGGAAEVLDRRREGVDVLLLVGADQLDQVGLGAVQPLDLLRRLLVERRLEVLEGEGEIEDVDIAARALRERPADQGAHRGRAVDGAGREQALHQQGAAVDLLDFDRRQLRRGLSLILLISVPFSSDLAVTT